MKSDLRIDISKAKNDGKIKLYDIMHIFIHRTFLPVTQEEDFQTL